MDSKGNGHYKILAAITLCTWQLWQFEEDTATTFTIKEIRKDSMFHFIESNYPFNLGMKNITMDDSMALSVYEMDVQNCKKVNISMMIFRNVPKILIHNVGEVVFPEEHTNNAPSIDNSRKRFKMSSSNTNLIPKGLFSNANYYAILIQKCNIHWLLHSWK